MKESAFSEERLELETETSSAEFCSLKTCLKKRMRVESLGYEKFAWDLLDGISSFQFNLLAENI